MGSRVRCRPVMAGVREVLSSSQVEAMLSTVATADAGRCNSLCDPDLKRKGAEYRAMTERGAYTALGLVYCSGARDGEYARLDNWKHNTLKKGCGA